MKMNAKMSAAKGEDWVQLVFEFKDKNIVINVHTTKSDLKLMMAGDAERPCKIEVTTY